MQARVPGVRLIVALQEPQTAVEEDIHLLVEIKRSIVQCLPLAQLGHLDYLFPSQSKLRGPHSASRQRNPSKTAHSSTIIEWLCGFVYGVIEFDEGRRK